MTRKTEILEKARELFNDSNTQAVTTNHIAKAMGISPGNLHYHYKNREEIVLLLYRNMREQMTLSIDELPKTIKQLNKHQELLMEIQWEYRFFFREMLFLFTRDNQLKNEYIKDNNAHRNRIRKSIEYFISNNELNPLDIITLEYLVDSILMSWQFYTSYIQTLGINLNKENSKKAVQYTNIIMRPFYTSSID